MKTILITGCSSGFGLETARYFLERNWLVVATMRAPKKNLFPESSRLEVLELDVTDSTSIGKIVSIVSEIDVLVNNAGVGLLNVFEGTPISAVRALFETNVIGPMSLIQAFLPALRKKRGSQIVNVSSSVTLKSLALLSAYTASKAALNGFTESLAHELEPFGIGVSLVLPGQARDSHFGVNARAWMEQQGITTPEPYHEYSQTVIEQITGGPPPELFTTAKDVAEAVWSVVNDPELSIRLPAGTDALAWAQQS